MKQISIIGCGWLGLPLAKHLLEAGYHIKGSTTSVDKLDALTTAGIEAFQVKLEAEGILGPIENCLSGSELLILNIPPGLRKDPESNFVKRMGFMLPYIENASIKKIIFISSTSVFADTTSLPTITEESLPNPETESGKQLLAVEHLFQNNKNFKTTVLRFAGLFGEDRDPAKFLSGKTDLKDPDGPVNLIHLEDCIGVIHQLILQNIWDDNFNASTTPHPSRKEYYTSICKIKNLPSPQFIESTTSRGKCIDSEKLQQLLNYKFKVRLNN